MTQNEFDNKVLSIAEKEINMVSSIADLRRQGDPVSLKLETNQIFLQNILSALRDYDVDAEILTDSEMDYLFELATCVTQTCP